MSIPRTRLSTGFSGSARALRARLVSMFKGKKLRPPLALLILAALSAALCGGLASCQDGGEAVGLEMDVQYYDKNGVCIEIPKLTAPGGALPGDAEALNGELAALKRLHDPETAWADGDCVFFPAVTERYLNLVFYLGKNSSGNDGDFLTWTYDKQENRLVDVEEALALAGTTQEALLDGLERLQNEDPEDPRPVLERSILGFRIKEDGDVVFYLSATVDEAGGYDGWYRLFTWEDGVYDRYSDFAFSIFDIRPLVPREELQAMDPPLWCQWYYEGGEPEGGFPRQQIPEDVKRYAQSLLEGYDVPEGAQVTWDEEDGLHRWLACDDFSGLELSLEWRGRLDAVECYSMVFQVDWQEDGAARVETPSFQMAFLREGDRCTPLPGFTDVGAGEPGRLAAPAPCNYRLMELLRDMGVITRLPELEELLRDNPAPSAAQSSALSWFYGQGAAERGERVYLAEDEPLRPEIGDRRIDAMEYAGLAVTYETYGVAYRVKCSGYQEAAGAAQWRDYDPIYLVLGMEQGCTLLGARGEGSTEKDVERVILEASYGLMDLDVSLRRDGWPWPAGPGSTVKFFHEEPEVTVLEGWEPIYAEGDSWQTYTWEGLSALCYCNAYGEYWVNAIETTRPDLFTWRGVRVGATRAELEAAYPDLTPDTGEDGAPCLRWGREEIFGPYIQFYLEGDAVSRIVLGNLFD